MSELGYLSNPCWIDHAELIVCHLQLPGHLECCTREVIRFVSLKLGKDTPFNLMFQYRPMYKAKGIKGLDRALTNAEITSAEALAQEAGLSNLLT